MSCSCWNDPRSELYGYEDAPATQLVATNCAACGRPLVDAESVSIGLGPECRKKYGYSSIMDPTVRDEANKLVYLIAARQGGMESVQATQRLRELGLNKLADIIMKRITTVRLEETNNPAYGYKVWFPYDPEVVAAIGRIPGRIWLKDITGDKAWFVPQRSKYKLLDLLKFYYKGVVIDGPKGPFML